MYYSCYRQNGDMNDDRKSYFIGRSFCDLYLCKSLISVLTDRAV